MTLSGGAGGANTHVSGEWEFSPLSSAHMLWHRPNVTSPDHLPNLLGTLDRDGNADSNRSRGKKFLGHIVSGNFGGKAVYVSQN